MAVTSLGRRPYGSKMCKELPPEPNYLENVSEEPAGYKAYEELVRRSTLAVAG